MLFGAQAIFAPDTREVVLVDRSVQDYLVQNQEEQQLHPVSPEDKSNLIQDFIDEEILVREAIARGYTDSSRVRTLLVQNMRFLLAGNIGEPEESELQPFFDQNLDEFTTPASVDIEQVVFDEPANASAEVLSQLNAGVEPSNFGRPNTELIRRMPNMDTKRLARAFGGKGAREILALDSSSRDWQGPIVSEIGSAHFIKFTANNPPRVPNFDSAKDWIETQWYATESRRIMDEELQKLRQNYRIEVDADDRDSDG